MAGLYKNTQLTPAQKKQHSQLIVDSLIDSNLLIEQLGGIQSFNRQNFLHKKVTDSLNFEQKLGHLYEDALEWVIHSSENFKQVLRSVAIREVLVAPQKGVHTLGELDYLLQTHEGEWLHIELAVKFYLAINDDGLQSWPGPDARDSWESKRQHMINHQFSLIKHPSTQQQLNVICGTHNVTSYHLIYGCLFDTIYSSVPQPAQDTATTAHRGLWMHSDQLTYSQLASLTKQSLWLIPKHLWPCPLTPKTTEALIQALTPITIEQTQQLIQEQQCCVMITNGSERYFITPNDYPKTYSILKNTK